MHKKIILIASLLSLSTPSFGVEYLKDKTPFVDNIQQIDDGGYSLSHNIPYLADAYEDGVIDGNMLFYSIEQQRKLRKWIDDNKPQRFVIVDISSYKMYLLTSISKDNFKAKNYFIDMETSVVVGNRYHKTPKKAINIISLKYNPTWTPTLNIMRRNAKIEDGEWNKSWIESNNFIPHSHETGEKITWEEADKLLLNEIYLVSPPSEKNALGKIKFETDSNQSIYLHDTNEKSFFEEQSRARSSGCVRVENPYSFAARLLYSSEEYIENNIAKGKTYWEKVDKTPVYFYYDIIEYKVNGENALKVTEDPYNHYEEYLKDHREDYVIE